MLRRLGVQTLKSRTAMCGISIFSVFGVVSEFGFRLAQAGRTKHLIASMITHQFASISGSRLSLNGTEHVVGTWLGRFELKFSSVLLLKNYDDERYSPSKFHISNRR